MAMHKIVAVKDLAVDGFLNPFVVVHTGASVRSFGDEVTKSDSPVAAHPQDYELYELGQFDTDTGAIFPLPNPLRIARALDYLPIVAAPYSKPEG